MTSHDTQLLLIILGITAGTFLTRGAFVLLPQRWALPDAWQAPLRYAPIAAIAAIIAPELFPQAMLDHGAGLDWLANPKLLGALAASWVYVRFANMGGSIAVGMATFWMVRYFAS